MSGSVFARLITSLTTIRGALLAAPVVVGIGAVLSLATPDTVHSKRAGVDQTAEAQSANRTSAPTMQLAQATSKKAETPAAIGSAKSAFTPAQRAEFGKLVREYLLANPEVIVEVSEELQRRQQAAAKQAATRSPLQQQGTDFPVAGRLSFSAMRKATSRSSSISTTTAAGASVH